jgi:hypothetical protein
MKIDKVEKLVREGISITDNVAATLGSRAKVNAAPSSKARRTNASVNHNQEHLEDMGAHNRDYRWSSRGVLVRRREAASS